MFKPKPPTKEWLEKIDKLEEGADFEAGTRAQMTTPRVDLPDATEPLELGEPDSLKGIFPEYILLSDHKEVVKEIYGRLSEAVNQIAADNVLEGKIAELEALNKRQALAIEKLKEQRNFWISQFWSEDSVEKQAAGEDKEIEAILQEAK